MPTHTSALPSRSATDRARGWHAGPPEDAHIAGEKARFPASSAIMGRMATPHGYSPISSVSRVRILELLGERADRTIEELVEATGLHSNTVREHLQRLIEGGYVLQTTERRATRGRPRALYRAATGEPDASSPIIRRKVEEAAERGDLMRRILPDTLTSDLDPDELHQLDAIIEHLEETGFEPLVDGTELTLDLSPCAHLDGSPSARVRCGVHLTLMQTVLTEAGGPLSVEGMVQTCNPRDCVIKLLRRD